VKKPNGVPLFYHNMRIWQGDLIFDGVNGTTKKWGIEKAYGGRLAENLTQSVARDVMAEIMERVDGQLNEDGGRDEAYAELPVMTVHDEIVWEIEAEHADRLSRWYKKQIAERSPLWAPGLPMAADLHVGVRYAK